jgi:DNA-binding transcriptional LysR family regulator
MDLIKLKSFITVAKLKNFRRASEELYFSQPAISAQIKELENYYNTELFERSGNKIKLTEAGELLLPYAQDLVQKFEESRYYVQNAFSKERGRLKIGTSTLPGVYFLPRIISGFTKIYPDIAIDLSVKYSAEIEKDILENNIHAGIIGTPEGVVFNSSLEKVELKKDHLVAVVNKNHKYFSRDSISIEEISRELLILPGKNTFTRKVVDDEMKKKGFHYKLEYEISNNEMIKKMVENNLGVSVLCSSMIGGCDRISGITINDLSSHRHINLIYRKDRKISPPMDNFLNYVIQESKKS